MGQEQTIDDDSMFRAAAGGDASAFAELLSRHREVVARVACRLVGGDWSAAEDIAQETFLRLWNAADRYEARGTLRSYLLTVAYRLAADYRRRQRPTTDLGDYDRHIDFSSDTGRLYETNALSNAVRDAVLELPDEQRAVFILSHYEGMKYREIADVIGCPIGTVASRKFQAVQTLRERLAPYLDSTEGVMP